MSETTTTSALPAIGDQHRHRSELRSAASSTATTRHRIAARVEVAQPATSSTSTARSGPRRAGAGAVIVPAGLLVDPSGSSRRSASSSWATSSTSGATSAGTASTAPQELHGPPAPLTRTMKLELRVPLVSMVSMPRHAALALLQSPDRCETISA
jgi:hypothetical protein